ncbi:hypothetical protein AC478_02840 [miscellaneous Crenarchaeota group-1 archaeon SG8-32-3]|uniref:Uncharacterized protein n=1 Tax=miscellaneous Crenarchaeota group-1 archaeon SG8-32-3 TaxID=1685125 RepID=A0A0M0BSQ5_9ARCH|nr:MAG: hypothetical protein AC478_02840 [miscellaneous Crenarchaeota group-1 archaeon SG8-32-3]
MTSKINLIELAISLVVLAIGAIYLWTVLPEIDTPLRIMILIIALILIVILANYLKQNIAKTNMHNQLLTTPSVMELNINQ